MDAVTEHGMQIAALSEKARTPLCYGVSLRRKMLGSVLAFSMATIHPIA